MSDQRPICFVAMPFGRTAAEEEHYEGWFQQVIDPGITAAGYDSSRVVSRAAPTQITVDILDKLTSAPMMVADLGGINDGEEPNPNVMYELGLRHAFSLPVVIMAWKDQRLPFDITAQRVLKEKRDLLRIPDNIKKLSHFIAAAATGDFYKPMDSIGRRATLQSIVAGGKDDALTAIVEELRQIRGKLDLVMGETEWAKRLEREALIAALAAGPTPTPFTRLRDLAGGRKPESTS